MNKRELTQKDRKRYEQFIRNWKKEIIQKEMVLARHAPGTAYHTRALRDIEGRRDRIVEFEGYLRDDAAA